MQPLVSIVTPSYNQAQFLEQTMLSVLGQDHPRLEYMIIDGASTDGSVEIIKKYTDRLAWWVSEKDKGQAEAINKGLRRAQGEIVAWLNSDDYYLPGAVTRATAAFSAHPDAGLVYGDVLAVDEKGQPINLIRYGGWGLEGLMAFRIIGQPAVFMRQAVLKQAGYLDPSYHCLLDHHLWLRLARLASAVYVPETWAAARYHAAAKNIARPEEFGREAYRIVDWMQSEPSLLPLFHRDEKRIRAGAHRFNAFYFLDGGKPLESLRAYGRGLRAHPPTVLRDWKRVLFAALSLVGFGWLRGIYLRTCRRSKLIP